METQHDQRVERGVCIYLAFRLYYIAPDKDFERIPLHNSLQSYHGNLERWNVASPIKEWPICELTPIPVRTRTKFSSSRKEFGAYSTTVSKISIKHHWDEVTCEDCRSEGSK